MDSHVSTCGACGSDVADGERFCENCGADQRSEDARPDPAPVAVPSPASRPAAPVSGSVCASCGGMFADDGYCDGCGTPRPDPRDHWSERPAGWVAGVCDRGIRHARNEDAMALFAEPEPGTYAALVVCDGVSSAPASDIASLAAAHAARDVLAGLGPAGATPVTGGAAARTAAWGDGIVAAAKAASQAILHAVADRLDAPEPPSCTFAAVVVDGPLVVCGWVGDSRVYWLPDSGTAEQLSIDDSWAQAMIAAGSPREQAENAPQAHAITRWLGPDASDDTPRCVPVVTSGPGWVVACSDGLWNYCSTPDQVAGVLRSATADVGTAPGDVASAMVAWANEQGGHDNITVALARLDTVPDHRAHPTLPADA